MSAAVVEALLDRPTPGLRREVPASRTSPAPTRSRPRRTGPGVGPSARPRRLRFVAPPARPRACHDDTVLVAAEKTRTWRLTERGVAVVLLVGAVLVAASVAVVGLTALRVTGESYRPTQIAVAPVVADH